ncbi:hypothetical protein [Enterobacter sp. CC120223-11]|uniref:hypothetical protein n=1 Tax=Enterobacter sp. CC120223-11 TaxID=1378073 RepID=UPI000BCD62F7|nr:hypothetical protein [Enterobacter sp. CC120223-11]SNY69833.1 hypothetical protein SAMN02744775_02224 [Enterobacter sp. CC120223-11]
MTKKLSLLALVFTVFYSNISASESLRWIRPNVISDVGGNNNSKFIFSLSPVTYSMEWGISNEIARRYIGYFIMMRSNTNNAGEWKFLDTSYVEAYKSIQGFSAAVDQFKNKTSIVSQKFSSYTSYCIGFGYSSYTSQSNITSDGRPKRVDGTDINFGDSDMSCGTYVPNYIPCKAGILGPLKLSFGNINLSEINAAKATSTLPVKCVYVEGVGSGYSGASYRIKLKSGDGIPLDNGTEATIYIDDKKINSSNGSGNFIINNATQNHNLAVSATLSGKPTKLGDFKGDGYLVMEFN